MPGDEQRDPRQDAKSNDLAASPTTLAALQTVIRYRSQIKDFMEIWEPRLLMLATKFFEAHRSGGLRTQEADGKNDAAFPVSGCQPKDVNHQKLVNQKQIELSALINVLRDQLKTSREEFLEWEDFFKNTNFCTDPKCNGKNTTFCNRSKRKNCWAYTKAFEFLEVDGADPGRPKVMLDWIQKALERFCADSFGSEISIGALADHSNTNLLDGLFYDGWGLTTHSGMLNPSATKNDSMEFWVENQRFCEAVQAWPKKYKESNDKSGSDSFLITRLNLLQSFLSTYMAAKKHRAREKGLIRVLNILLRVRCEDLYPQTNFSAVSKALPLSALALLGPVYYHRDSHHHDDSYGWRSSPNSYKQICASPIDCSDEGCLYVRNFFVEEDTNGKSKKESSYVTKFLGVRFLLPWKLELRKTKPLTIKEDSEIIDEMGFKWEDVMCSRATGVGHCLTKTMGDFKEKISNARRAINDECKNLFQSFSDWVTFTGASQSEGEKSAVVAELRVQLAKMEGMAEYLSQPGTVATDLCFLESHRDLILSISEDSAVKINYTGFQWNLTCSLNSFLWRLSERLAFAETEIRAIRADWQEVNSLNLGDSKVLVGTQIGMELKNHIEASDASVRALVERTYEVLFFAYTITEDLPLITQEFQLAFERSQWPVFNRLVDFPYDPIPSNVHSASESDH